ncbi:tyrosine-type recombinase/integrase, partial [Peptoniphilus genitalis]
VYKELIRDRAILELLLATGMRISELCSLKKINVIYSNNILKIFGKGAKERVLPIFHSKLINDLITYENLFNDDLKNFEYLFINKRKNKISSQSVAHMIKKYCRMADINLNITPHMFRHTFATMLLDQDVDSRQIQIILGHSSITTTQIYTNITSKKRNDIMKNKNPLSIIC